MFPINIAGVNGACDSSSSGTSTGAILKDTLESFHQGVTMFGFFGEETNSIKLNNNVEWNDDGIPTEKCLKGIQLIHFMHWKTEEFEEIQHYIQFDKVSEQKKIYLFKELVSAKNKYEENG
uniref:Uncharacterized protein n=1 Tax=Romanomermis culicivorax TaxID=13658 RepID=A0A915IPP9_ROMCU